MPNMIETCAGCGSRDIILQRDTGWITGSWKMLRCRACGRKIFHSVPGWTLALYGIALLAAGWTLLSVF
jgi:hypothetical protein